MIAKKIEEVARAQLRCEIKSGTRLTVLGVDDSVSLKQYLDALAVIVLGCEVERCLLEQHQNIDIGLSIKKELDALSMTSPRCNSERCVVADLGIDTDTSLEERLDVCDGALLGCAMQSLNHFIHWLIRLHGRPSMHNLATRLKTRSTNETNDVRECARLGTRGWKVKARKQVRASERDATNNIKRHRDSNDVNIKRYRHQTSSNVIIK